MDRPLRLLGFGNGYPPAVIGGYPEVSADVLEGLAGRGHDVTMLVCPRTLPRGAPGPEGSRVKVRRELDYVLAAWRHPVAGMRAVARDQRVVRAALAEGVDAAIVWHMRGVMKTSLRLVHDAGVPVLYMLHDRWVLYERAGPWLRPWPAIDRAGFAAARNLVARAARPRIELGAPPIERDGINCFVTKWLEDEHRRLGWRPRVSHVVRGGFDLAPFVAAGATRAPGVPPRRLVFAGRVDWRKGLDTAVDGIAAAGLGHVLVVAGPVDDPNYRDKVAADAERLGVQLEWLGALPRAELPALFASCDAMVYPSTEPESYGLGLIEAMAAGRPVITSALGGPREYLVDGENSLVFEPRDAGGLASALRVLEDDPDLVASIAVNGATMAAQHGIEPVLDRVEALLAATILD